MGANITANHILINGIGPFPAMGLNGIALSTSVIYLLMGGGLLIYIGLSLPCRASALFHRIWVMDWQITWRVLKIGTPIGLPIVAETGMFIAMALMITALFQTFDGAQVIGISVLRGLNDTKWPALLSVSSFWVIGVISGAIISFYFDGGAIGLCLGLFIGLTSAACSLGWRMHRSMKRINSGGSILMG